MGIWKNILEQHSHVDTDDRLEDEGDDVYGQETLYCVVAASTIAKIQEQVTAKIKANWVCTGGVQVVAEGNSLCGFIQAMQKTK